jgi:hypothetical protein
MGGMTEGVFDSLPTIEDVRQWKVEREKIALEVEGLSARLSDLDAKLNAIKVIVPSLDLDKIAAPLIARSRAIENPQSIPDLLLSILLKSDGAHNLKSLYRSAIDSDIGDRVERSQNGFYNSISKLTKRGLVVRKDDRIYATEVYAKILAGEKDDVLQYEEQSSQPKSQFTNLIINTLRGKKFLATKELVSLLKRHEEVEARLNRNPQYIYTILGRMSKRGDIVRKGNAYALPEEADESLNGSAVGDSLASEGAHPSLIFAQPATDGILEGG